MNNECSGANSTVRNLVEYAGYVTWRGRVPEGDVMAETKKALKDRIVVMRFEGGYSVR